MADLEELKLYYDTKSPFAYLAAEPAFALPERYRVHLRWLPYCCASRGRASAASTPTGRPATRTWTRGAGRTSAAASAILGPQKIYDSTPSLIGGLFAEREGFFREYLLETYRRFFERRLEIDEADAVAGLVRELRGAEAEAAYRAFLAGDGPKRLDACVEEGHADHVFGVPIFALRGELFWGHDRMPLLEERLAEYGLAR